MLNHVKIWAGLLFAIASLATSAEECRGAIANEAVTQCLGKELRETDAKIDSTYKELMLLLDAGAKIRLRDQERAWIKERDAVCGLNSKEPDREKWYQTILLDSRKTVCVTRYTRVRTIELSSLLAQNKSVSNGEAARPQESKPVEPPPTPRDYMVLSPISRSSGLWYFEIAFNSAAIVKSNPGAVWMGCLNAATNDSMGFNFNLREGEPVSPKDVVGVALDLNNGRMYFNVNGSWRGREPGSATGLPITLGKAYRCGTESTIVAASLLKDAKMDVNFGDRSFANALPTGYQPFLKKESWLFINSANGVRTYLDYASVQLEGIHPQLSWRQDNDKDILEGMNGKSYRSKISTLEFDCGNSSVREVSAYALDPNNEKIGIMVNSSDMTHSVEPGSSGAALMHSLCFLKSNQFPVPDLGLTETWREMASPAPDVSISKALRWDRYKNGFLLWKAKNELTTPKMINGLATKYLTAVSAVDCKRGTAHQVFGIGLDDRGEPLGISFYSEMDNYPKLPANKQLLTDACAIFPE